MSEEVSIHIGVPTVRQTRLQGNGTIEARAETNTAAFSVHYSQRANGPTVGQRLLVAVLNGIHPEWLPPKETMPVTFEAVSAENNGLHRILTGDGEFDALHLSAVDRGSATRLCMTMTDESASKLHANVVLNKWQVTQMLAALIAIYPRLHEDFLD